MNRRFVTVKKVNNPGGYKYAVMTNVYAPHMYLYGNRTMFQQFKTRKAALPVAKMLRRVGGLKSARYKR